MLTSVLSEPTDLDRAELADALSQQWGLHAERLEYMPVGFGSHHWHAIGSGGTERFVTVDDLEAGFQAGAGPDGAFAALERAYKTANVLRDDAGLEFVLAPLRDEDGTVVRRLTARYAVTVSPFVDGESSEWGRWESADDRRLMGAVLGQLHAVTEQVPDGLPRHEDFELPSRRAVTDALQELDRPWNSGPFAESTRQLLLDAGVDLQRRLAEYDALAEEVRGSSEPWVITHGEPHRANVIRTAEGPRLVDWDTTLIAPRERDLRMVLDEELTGWDEYLGALGEDIDLDTTAIELYTKWWDLADIAIYVALFRRPHERDENTIASWENLTHCLRPASR